MSEPSDQQTNFPRGAQRHDEAAFSLTARAVYAGFVYGPLRLRRVGLIAGLGRGDRAGLSSHGLSAECQATGWSTRRLPGWLHRSAHAGSRWTACPPPHPTARTLERFAQNERHLLPRTIRGPTRYPHLERGAGPTERVPNAKCSCCHFRRAADLPENRQPAWAVDARRPCGCAPTGALASLSRMLAKKGAVHSRHRSRGGASAATFAQPAPRSVS